MIVALCCAMGLQVLLHLMSPAPGRLGLCFLASGWSFYLSCGVGRFVWLWALRVFFGGCGGVLVGFFNYYYFLKCEVSGKFSQEHSVLVSKKSKHWGVRAA